MSATPISITIRLAHAGDEPDLRRLAALDSAEGPPPSPLMLAEVDGAIRAALSLRDGAAIADPFYPTAQIVELLRAHAASAGGVRVHRRPRRLRLAFG